MGDEVELQIEHWTNNQQVAGLTPAEALLAQQL